MAEQPRPNTANILAHIEKRLAVIEERLTILGDHETRLRELEKAKNQNAVIIGIITAGITALVVAVATGVL
jgi:hypothetical protein